MTTDQPSAASSDGRTAPTVVSTAAYLQYLIFALSLISTILTFVYLGDMVDAAQADMIGQGAPQDDVDDVKTQVEASAFSAIFGTVIAALVAVWGFLHLRGKNWARITTWVFAGVLLLCSLLLLVLSGSAPDDDDADYEAAYEAAADAMPGWAGAYGLIATVVTLASLVAVVILLLLPAANDYFRKEPPKVEIPGAPPA